ncbi:amidase [Methylobacterium nodulans]|uniref:Indoleacetamide hydrolase n=1 Tax=Methylobacterium nodulans (strain LMG 21967 / CNCM I-2342 / ORS 2060) TaxID=460265 RepID=B8ICF1_METNO|nr:amidase [Methylobacterium nodulans]ACL55539.1 Amidase [Methylobacterium nodulans ORS 2060]
MTLPSDLVTLHATDLAQAIRSRAVSAREVMQAHLDQIARFNPAVTAIVSLRDPELLLAEAEAADRDLAAGRWRGPLHGLPHAVKDTSPAQGMPWTQGSPVFRSRMPEADAPYVARLRQAGAILIGKTNVPEFGLGSHTVNPVFGPTRNAYDPGRSAGGSSGGAAVALALRMLPLADGSDHAGSLRNPAAWNGVLGLRPSPGRVPLRTDEVFLPDLTVAGPMARCTADLGLLLSVMAGPDPRLPQAIQEDPAPFARPQPRDLPGLRVGWLGDCGGHLATEPGVLDLCEQGLAVLEARGARVEPLALGLDPEEVWQAWRVLRAWLAGGAQAPLWRDPQTRAALKPEAAWEVEEGLKLDAFAILEASAMRSRWYAQVLRLFETVDLLALPAAQVFPFPIEEAWPRRIAGRDMDTYHRWMEVTIPATMAGCPAISLPAGRNQGGLPMGLQLIAPHRGEAALLSVAAAYEEATAFDRMLPPPLTAP